MRLNVLCLVSGIVGLVLAFATSMPDAYAALFGFLVGCGGEGLFGSRQG